jgi:hypothetical protein
VTRTSSIPQVPVHRGQATLGRHQDDRHLHSGLPDQAGEPSDGREVATAVDQQQVGRRRVEQGGGLGLGGPHDVGEQAQGRQHLGRGLHGTGSGAGCATLPPEPMTVPVAAKGEVPPRCRHQPSRDPREVKRREPSAGPAAHVIAGLGRNELSGTMRP